MTEGQAENSIPPKTPFCGAYKQVFSTARTMNMRGNKIVFLVFGKTLEEPFVRFSCVALPFYPV